MLVVTVAILFAFNFARYDGGQEYVLLAKSFLQGKTYLPGNYFKIDTAYYNGHFFWPLGPFPAILIIPFIRIFDLLNLGFRLGYIHFFLSLGIFYLCFKIASYYKYSVNDSFSLAYAFCFASVYQAIALFPISQYLTHSLTVFLLLLTLYGHILKKINPWSLGTIFALILATRLVAFFTIIFFILSYSIQRVNFGRIVSSTFKLSLPIFISLVFLGLYNLARFGNPFETGYGIANAWNMTSEQRADLMKYGLFSIKYVPTNFYYYFVKTVDPILMELNSNLKYPLLLAAPFIKVGYPGVGFFITSPIFLYAFKTKLRGKNLKLILMTIGVVTFIYLTHYSPGWGQVGPRYLLDILPFAYLLLLNSFNRNGLTTFQKSLVYLSSLFNFYLFLTYVLLFPTPL